MPTPKINGRVSVNVYEIILRAVESGVAYGLNRAYKHTDEKPPSEQQKDIIKEKIHEAVMSELCEVLKFE